jgi:hypothetical protein
MSTLYFSFLGFAKRFFTAFMIILEIAVLLFSINYLYSAMEGRRMLLEPYEGFLNNNSVFIYNNNIFNDLPMGLSENESKEKTLSGLIGNYREIEILSTSVYLQCGTLIRLYVCDDDVFLKMNFPLLGGHWVTKNELSTGAIASHSLPRGNVGVDFPSGVLYIDIKGNLTHNTYSPTMGNWGGADMSCIDFYRARNHGDEPFIVVGRSAIQNIDDFFRSTGSLLLFDNLTSTEGEHNLDYLMSVGASPIRGERIYERSIFLIYEDLERFYPLIFCVGVIVLIGIISFSCIIYKSCERDNGIFFMHGNTRNGSLKILAGELSIILILSSLLTAIAFWFSYYFSLLGEVRVTFSTGNIIITLITLFTLLLFMMIIPYILYTKSTPIEIIRRSL